MSLAGVDLNLNGIWPALGLVAAVLGVIATAMFGWLTVRGQNKVAEARAKADDAAAQALHATGQSQTARAESAKLSARVDEIAGHGGQFASLASRYEDQAERLVSLVESTGALLARASRQLDLCEMARAEQGKTFDRTATRIEGLERDLKAVQAALAVVAPAIIAPPVEERERGR